jgi:alpha-glucosidase
MSKTIRAIRLVAPILCVVGTLFLQASVSGEDVPPLKTSIQLHREQISPVADPRSTVLSGNARFTILTPQLIRMEWAANGKFEDHASLVFLNRRLPVPEFSVRRGSDGIVIETSKVKLSYHPVVSEEKFSASNLIVEFQLEGKSKKWNPGMPDTGNLLGTARTLDNLNHSSAIVPLDPGLISRSGWVVVDDSIRPLFDSTDFDFEKSERSSWPWVMERPTGECQDWYFFGYGHDYKRALGDFVRVAGRIPLPPRFAFGSWWSRYWAYSDQELESLVQEFHENDVPLDVLVIDMEWHNTLGMHYDQKDSSGNKLGWTGYSWDHDLFPYPEDFLHKMHQQGLEVTLNLHPAAGVQPWEDRYAQMAKAMEIDPSTQKYVPFDITNKKYAQNYMDILLHPIEKQGIDFWWLDWQQGSTTSIPELNPTWWLNYVHFTDQEREGKRPLLFHRWGGLGNHRYQIGFSGDTISDWATLNFQPEFTATAANVGYAYWSHDIGGHIPGKVDPELYTRWVQFGVFSPILRTHTTKSPEAERRIWAYPEPYSRIMRDAFHLRYAIEPYIYTEARRTYDTGVAFLHPLYYEWPEQQNAYEHKDEYMFGESILVAPVTHPVDAATGLAEDSLWIPPGTWIEWQTGKHITGPSVIKRRTSIDQTPIYIRAGSIIPMQPEMRYTGERAVSPLILAVFPLAEGQESNYVLYEDSSKDEQYKNGICAWTKIDARRNGDTETFHIHPVEGQYIGMQKERGYEIRLTGDWPPEAVEVNGVSVDLSDGRSGHPSWRFEGNTLTTLITVPPISVTQEVQIKVVRNHADSKSGADIDGFAGSLTRLRAAYDSLNALWPQARSPRQLINALQTGDRLTYFPQNALAELAQYPKLYAQVLEQTQKILSGVRAKSVTNGKTSTPQAGSISQENKLRLLSLTQRALKQLKDGAPTDLGRDAGVSGACGRSVYRQAEGR